MNYFCQLLLSQFSVNTWCSRWMGRTYPTDSAVYVCISLQQLKFYYSNPMLNVCMILLCGRCIRLLHCPSYAHVIINAWNTFSDTIVVWRDGYAVRDWLTKF